MLHAGDVEVSGVLEELAELISALARVHQVIKPAGVLSKGTYVLLRLLVK